jgi:hypothetical protein
MLNFWTGICSITIRLVVVFLSSRSYNTELLEQIVWRHRGGEEVTLFRASSKGYDSPFRANARGHAFDS